MDRVNWERRGGTRWALQLAEELGRDKQHPGAPRVKIRPRDSSIDGGQPGLTGPQRERGQEGGEEALTPGSPEGAAQVTST